MGAYEGSISLGSKIVSHGSIAITSGWGTGGAIKLSKLNDSFVHRVGVGGAVTRVYTGDDTWQAELTLTQLSPFNGLLQAVANADAKAAAAGLPGLGVSQFQVADLAGRVFVLAPNSWIQKPADHEETNDAVDKVWMFVLPNCFPIFT